MPFSRRRFLGIATLPIAVATPGTLAAAEAPIRQPAVADAAHFMARAQDMLRSATDSGDQPYGAVVVRDGRIVGEAPSRVVTNGDPTAHAEMEAIRDAARRLGSRDLAGCVIYSTTRPCRMCETAGYWAGLDRSFSGAAITDNGRPGYGSC